VLGSYDVPALLLAGCVNDNVVSVLLLGRNSRNLRGTVAALIA
jgi:hypothetical protein